MSVYDAATFEQFQNELAAALQTARAVGTPEAAIRKSAAALGDYFAQAITPKNPEQRLLKGMWDVATEAEQQAIASVLIKLVDKRPTAH